MQLRHRMWLLTNVVLRQQLCLVAILAPTSITLSNNNNSNNNLTNLNSPSNHSTMLSANRIVHALQ